MAEPKKTTASQAKAVASSGVGGVGSTRTALLVLGIALALSAAGNLYLGSKVYSGSVASVDTGAVPRPPVRHLPQQQEASEGQCLSADGGAGVCRQQQPEELTATEEPAAIVQEQEPLAEEPAGGADATADEAAAGVDAGGVDAGGVDATGVAPPAPIPPILSGLGPEISKAR